jgi:hypothetical protein
VTDARRLDTFLATTSPRWALRSASRPASVGSGVIAGLTRSRAELISVHAKPEDSRATYGEREAGISAFNNVPFT